MIKGIGHNPTDRGNKTGYVCSVIQWNSRKGFAGMLDLFYRYFHLTRDSYFMKRIYDRDALQKTKNNKNADLRKRLKVIININKLLVNLWVLVFEKKICLQIQQARQK